MPEKYTYLAVDFFCVVFPLFFSFLPRFAFYRQWRYFLPPAAITAVFFILWDILFTHIGVWRFNRQYVTGSYLFGLPMEEYLFFICIPYSCTFTYHCLTSFFTFSVSRRARIFTWVFIVFLTLTALLHVQRLYTSVTFLLLAAFIVLLIYKKVTFLPAFFVCFAVILLPFFISNGILTGGIIH